ncbi:hypothetical protein RND81_10G118600 [Saponaria officinalis]|uniref:Uncharacterized protein n=1 Tax=Saponaria officinalis TaxID=3572 RepID=A0AAW1I3G3_SAPOF
MGNNIGGGYNKAAKIMKINGEYFKLKTPSKVIDIIKDYPDHILLDSDDFLRFNLRAKPLDLQFQLKPKKIYLLFELPKFPEINNINNININNNINDNVVNKSSLRRVRSGVEESTITNSKELRKFLMSKRSISDLSIKVKSTVGDGGGGGVGPTRVKVRLPKGQVKRIIEECNDDVEVAQRILRLFATVDGGDAVVEGGGGGGRDVESENGVVVEEEEEEEMEVEVVDRHCFNVHGLCGSHQRKYKKIFS